MRRSVLNRRWATFWLAVKAYLISKGYEDDLSIQSKGIEHYAPILEKLAKIEPPGHGPYSSPRSRLFKAAFLLKIIPLNQLPIKGAARIRLIGGLRRLQIKKTPKRNFYASLAWKKLRYATLVRYGGRCMACGTTKGSIQVDHIKPISEYWDLRLDPENLQVLCGMCNEGKLNLDCTDWRPVKKPWQILIAQREQRLMSIGLEHWLATLKFD